MKLQGSRTGLIAGLVTIAIVSQFLRSSLGVIAPDLIRDLSLSPQALGLAGGMFFLALGVAQVPVGMSFDRIGPRLTVAWVSVFALAGTVVFGLCACLQDEAAFRIIRSHRRQSFVVGRQRVVVTAKIVQQHALAHGIAVFVTQRMGGFVVGQRRFQAAA